ncbi:MAG: AbrB/MazE/SpoVT family DNA-binding domain-containing protein [Candidatus Hodarchaeales archaeon]
MAVILELDERGRITIPKEWREKLHLKKAVAIQSKQGILLIPVSNDPFDTLKGAFTTKKTVKELKNQADELLHQEK